MATHEFFPGGAEEHAEAEPFRQDAPGVLSVTGIKSRGAIVKIQYVQPGTENVLPLHNFSKNGLVRLDAGPRTLKVQVRGDLEDGETVHVVFEDDT